jgi:hypothetical protein
VASRCVGEAHSTPLNIHGSNTGHFNKLTVNSTILDTKGVNLMCRKK